MPVPNTQSTHFVKPAGPFHLMVSDFSSALSVMTVRIVLSMDESVNSQMTDDDVESSVEQETRFNVGDWVVVNFEEAMFPGETIDVISSQLVVNVMHPSGNGWKWPDKKDMIPYDISEVVKRIEPPVPSGSRGQFHFDF